MSHQGNDEYWENKLEAMMEESIMGCEWCGYCDKTIDLDCDVEHWEEKEYLKGRDEWKCRVELKDENWAKQCAYGDAVNKKDKENREDAHDRIHPPEHK